MDSPSILDGIQHNYGWVYPIFGFAAAGIATRLRGSREKRLAAARENLKGLVELAGAGVITIPKSRLNRGRRHVEKLAAKLYDKQLGPPRWYTGTLLILSCIVIPFPVLMSSLLEPDQLEEDVPIALYLLWFVLLLVLLLAALFWALWILIAEARAQRPVARIKLWWKRRRRKRRVAQRQRQRLEEASPANEDS